MITINMGRVCVIIATCSNILSNLLRSHLLGRDATRRASTPRPTDRDRRTMLCRTTKAAMSVVTPTRTLITKARKSQAYFGKFIKM